MKTYLVTCDLGGSVIKPFKIEVDDDNYVPVSDDMALLKKSVLELYHPRFHDRTAAPSRCGGYISINERNPIESPENLKIVAVSRIDI